MYTHKNNRLYIVHSLHRKRPWDLNFTFILFNVVFNINS